MCVYLSITAFREVVVGHIKTLYSYSRVTTLSNQQGRWGECLSLFFEKYFYILNSILNIYSANL